VEVCCLSKEVDKDSNDWRELLDLVRQLRKSRSSEMYKPPDEEPDLLRLKALQDSDVEVYKILCREAQFREKSEIRLFDVGSGKKNTGGDVSADFVTDSSSQSNGGPQIL